MLIYDTLCNMLLFTLFYVKEAPLMKKILTAIVLIPILTFLFILIAAPFINDGISKKTANELADYPLPGDTELIESVAKAGKLVGCGNGMQYFGAILIKSELSLGELSDYYNSFSENRRECTVEHQTANNIQVLEHAQLNFKTDIDGDNYFIVYAWGDNQTIFHEFDLRGH